MIVTFDRDPCGWVHPFYRRQHHVHPFLGDLGSFVGPALETVGSLSRILQLAQQEPRVVRSSGREQQQRDKFEVRMNVQQYAPEELDVKMVDNFVVVEGKHEEKKDEHGFISRHFVRRYELPEDVKPESVTCNLSSDGILLVSAPRIVDQKPATEKTIPINFTGQPAVEQNEGNKEEATNVNDTKDGATEKHQAEMEVSNAE